MTAPRGVDVSSYNPTDYATAGLGFVFVKATEGTGYVNPRHAAQVAHGRTSGLVVGHYHFVRPGSMSAQVSYFLQHAAPAPGDVLALDWEDTGVTGDAKDAFLRGLKAATPGHKSVLYCNLDFWRGRDRTSYTADGLWIADPDAPAGQPRIQHPWLFHQYGESSGLDLDIANFPSLAALRAWAAGTTPTPNPEPDMSLPQTDLDAIAHAVASYSHGDDPDVHQTWQDAAADANAAKVQASANGTSLSALTTKVDAMLAKVEALGVAQAPTIDYAKLAAALLTAVKGA